MNNVYNKSPLNILLLSVKWVVFCLLLTPVSSYSAENVLAVMSSDKSIYQDFYSKLNAESHRSIDIIEADNINDEILNRHDIIITIGYRAAKKISKYKLKTTIIYSLIPDNEKIRYSLSCENKNCYYIYINQPVIQYVKLFKILFPKNRSIVLATTEANTKIAQQLKKSSASVGVISKELHIQKNGNIARAFTNKLSSDDVLLALPNHTIYNSNNARSILLSTYHKDVPIIAYSKAFVKAGAIAGLYSGIHHVADKTARVLNKILKEGHQKQKEYYPDEFIIKINSAVANSLNVNVNSENDIKRKLK